MNYTNLQLEIFLPRRRFSRLWRRRYSPSSKPFLDAMLSPSIPKEQRYGKNAQDADDHANDDCCVRTAACWLVPRTTG